MGIEAIIKGFGGELKTRFIYWLFLGKGFTVFNNILIEVDGVSTQIDHIIVSKYGIFSVETKDKTGWLYGSEKQSQWTQTIFGKRYRQTFNR
ncbi:nuclease-related domain-containing protein [Chloroflexota bacterium]